MKSERVYLTGFMTSGKSTIGPILANTLGWDYFDLDSEIENQEKKTVVQIFESNGEEYFRNAETKKLKELSAKTKVVIALGGGTMTNNENFGLIKKTGKIIYLKASPEIIYKRIKNKLDRPLFKDLVLNEKPQEEFIARIRKILKERSEYYESSDLTINTDEYKLGFTIDKLVKKIKRMLHENN